MPNRRDSQSNPRAADPRPVAIWSWHWRKEKHRPRFPNPHIGLWEPDHRDLAGFFHCHFSLISFSPYSGHGSSSSPRSAQARENADQSLFSLPCLLARYSTKSSTSRCKGSGRMLSFLLIASDVFMLHHLSGRRGYLHVATLDKHPAFHPRMLLPQAYAPVVPQAPSCRGSLVCPALSRAQKRSGRVFPRCPLLSPA
ncbi:MAG: hypothetical protein HW408_700 [Actinobacteria bacterium]|nr:hypothetical protein [Actinomycetota bacterium]